MDFGAFLRHHTFSSQQPIKALKYLYFHFRLSRVVSDFRINCSTKSATNCATTCFGYPALRPGNASVSGTKRPLDRLRLSERMKYSDFVFVLATFIKDDNEKGFSLILVERGHPYEIQDLKTALNSQSKAQVFFNDVKVPPTKHRTSLYG